MATKKSEFPAGWDEARVRRVLDYYERQTDEEAAAEAVLLVLEANRALAENEIGGAEVIRESPATPSCRLIS